ncbi:MAG: transposase [Lewinellaceae bacterium]|nr:transposase [Lewinellaceae bacterium]
MDGIVFKVRENSRVTNKTVYLAVGLKKDGGKRFWACGWVKVNRQFWMGVLTDIKARGVEDILITVTDNSTVLPDY